MQNQAVDKYISDIVAAECEELMQSIACRAAKRIVIASTIQLLKSSVITQGSIGQGRSSSSLHDSVHLNGDDRPFNHRANDFFGLRRKPCEIWVKLP